MSSTRRHDVLALIGFAFTLLGLLVLSYSAAERPITGDVKIGLLAFMGAVIVAVVLVVSVRFYSKRH